MPDHIEQINLYGRIFLQARIRAVTGLHIGGAPAALSIGSVDNPVLRDPLTNRPYVPGSSVRGKMRSLWEKMTGAPQNQRIGAGVYIHMAQNRAEYEQSEVSQIFGVTGNAEASFPTRLLVRDALLSDESEKKLREQAHTDLPYTEVKWEAAIDRVTSAATPRQMERVPRDSAFDGFELVFSIYRQQDITLFVRVLEAMQLLQDDYLGGQGSRGSGKIAFEDVQIGCRARNDYGTEKRWQDAPNTVAAILAAENRAKLLEWLRQEIPIEAYRPPAS
jgi:CRISPR-associated protein Csm3